MLITDGQDLVFSKPIIIIILITISTKWNVPVLSIGQLFFELKGCWKVSISFKFSTYILRAKSAEPDRTPHHYAASDLV